MSVEQVASGFLDAFGRRIDIELDKGDKPHEAMLSRVDAAGREPCLAGVRCSP